jgi:hypothetical protein
MQKDPKNFKRTPKMKINPIIIFGVHFVMFEALFVGEIFLGEKPWDNFCIIWFFFCF